MDFIDYEIDLARLQQSELAREVANARLARELRVEQRTSAGWLQHSVAQLQPQTADAALRRGATVIDVRGRQAWRRGHIVGSLRIEPEDLPDALPHLETEGSYVIVCQRGLMSAAAANMLAIAGFPNVSNLKGGLNAWARAGLPLQATEPSGRFTAWSLSCLTTQGYGALSPEQRRAVSLGLRVTTGLCLAGVIGGLVLGSPSIFLGLAVIAAIGGLTPRHPFDFVWQYGLRRAVGGAPLPPNPPERRLPFLIASPWLAGLAVLYAAVHGTIGLIAGMPFVISCALVTTTHFCVPGTLFALLRPRLVARRAAA